MCKSHLTSHCSLWIWTLQLVSVILNHSKHIVHEHGIYHWLAELFRRNNGLLQWRVSRLSTLGLRSEDIESLFHLLVKLNPWWILARVEVSKIVNIHLSSSYLTLWQCVWIQERHVLKTQCGASDMCGASDEWTKKPQVHYAPGFDLLARAKQTLQKLAYVAWHREVSNFLFWGPAKSVAFVNC